MLCWKGREDARGAKRGGQSFAGVRGGTVAYIEKAKKVEQSKRGQKDLRELTRLDGAEVADVPEPREYLGRRPVQPRVRQRHETPRALLRAHRTAHAHVPVGQHAVVRRRVVNLGHHVFELRVGWPVEDDAGAPLGVVVEDEDDGVAPPALFGFGRE